MPKQKSVSTLETATTEPLDKILAALQAKPPVKSKISENEWNFAKCPSGQLQFCKIYEYARSSPQARSEVERWRQTNFARADKPMTANAELENLRRMDFFRKFPEFPDTRWLDFPPPEVKRRLAEMPKRQPILVRSVAVSVLEEAGEYRDQIQIIEPHHTPTVQPIEVNWFFNDKVLIAAFAEWLRAHRPYRAQEMRGKTSPRELLNALAAYRLLQLHTHLEAVEITSTILNKKPLFRSQSDWLDAKRKAEDEIAGRLPPHPSEKLWKRLDKKGFTEDEMNALWQHWVGLTEGQARPLYLLTREKFTAKMRALLREISG